MSKNAIVISGGGCKGAFAVGILKYIYQNVAGLEFDIFCGTSTGALILPLAITNEIGELADIYGNSFTNDIIKKRDITLAGRDGYLFNAGPLKKLIENSLTQERFQRIMNSGKEFYISAVCLQSGKITYFTNSDNLMSNLRYDVKKINTREELIDAIRASAHQPVFMEAIKISGFQYVDGGVRDYLPIMPAIDTGAEKILSIIHSSENEIHDYSQFKDLLSIAKRSIDLMSTDVGANDYEIAKLRDTNGSVLEAIRPDAMLAKDGLEFIPEEMRRNIDKGYEKAEAYNWDVFSEIV